LSIYLRTVSCTTAACVNLQALVCFFMRQYLNNPIANCVSSINLGYAAKQLFVELPVSNQLHRLLTIFVALGVVQSFSIKKPVLQTCLRSLNPITGSGRIGLHKFFAPQAKLPNVSAHRYGSGYSFVVYLKYVGYTPVFSGMRNY
jgi:ribosomal protein S8